SKAWSWTAYLRASRMCVRCRRILILGRIGKRRRLRESLGWFFVSWFVPFLAESTGLGLACNSAILFRKGNFPARAHRFEKRRPAARQSKWPKVRGFVSSSHSWRCERVPDRDR